MSVWWRTDDTSNQFVFYAASSPATSGIVDRGIAGMNYATVEAQTVLVQEDGTPQSVAKIEISKRWSHIVGPGMVIDVTRPLDGLPAKVQNVFGYAQQLSMIDGIVSHIRNLPNNKAMIHALFDPADGLCVKDKPIVKTLENNALVKSVENSFSKGVVGNGAYVVLTYMMTTWDGDYGGILKRIRACPWLVVNHVENLFRLSETMWKRWESLCAIDEIPVMVYHTP